MRILIAYDGSRFADDAVALASTLAWPFGTTIRVAQVLADPPQLPGNGVFGPYALDAHLVARCASLRRAGVTVEPMVLRAQHPATAIVDSAASFGADLIVTGHRGHGGLATVLLGSVARDVAEHGHCSVLVARRPSCARIVVADDGSEGARRARQVVSEWPMFAGQRVFVLSVATVPQPLHSGIAVSVRGEALSAQAETERDARIAHERLAIESAEQLRIAGRNASGAERSGQPTEAIVAFAREHEADLIVLGTRGRGPLARVLLGSVARGVLMSAETSVLVAR